MADETTTPDTPEEATPTAEAADVAPESNIVESATPAEVDLTGGVAHGTVEKDPQEGDSPNTVEVRNRIDYREAVVHETDENGNVTGWHKEPVEGAK